MAAPVHFDLAAAEATIRATIAKTEAQFTDMDGLSAEDRQLVEMQIWLSEMQVTVGLAFMRAANAGISREIAAQAAGHQFGTVIANIAQNLQHPAALPTIISVMERTIMDCMDGGASAGPAVRTTGSVVGVSGGHA